MGFAAVVLRRLACDPAPVLVPCLVPGIHPKTPERVGRCPATSAGMARHPLSARAPYPEADAVSAMSLAGPGYGIFGSCPGSVSL